MTKLKVKIISGVQPYLPIWKAMKAFVDQKSANANLSDQLWLLEHQSVFTQGQAGKAEHVLNPHTIPVVQTDRGGQVTYHGPGQLMVYTLFNLNALNLHTRDFVHTLEQCVIDYLKLFNLNAQSNPDAPGVYLNERKICSIGLRVRKGISYHGIAFNVNMDLTPFSYINPCGFKSLKMTQLSEYTKISLNEVIDGLLPIFMQKFGMNQVEQQRISLTDLTDEQTAAL